MSLFNYLKLNYTSISNSFLYLEKNEWFEMIKLFCNKLAAKNVGNLLSTKLIEFVQKGYSITITNCDYPISNTIYPKIRYVNKNNVLIVIPNVPYFTSNYTVDSTLFTDIDISNKILCHFKSISDCVPSIKINRDQESECNFLFQIESAPPLINFSHELIHCLRYFENQNNDYSDEEEATIYGLRNNVLMYNIDSQTIYMTENSIRREWKLNPRVNHDSVENFCHQVRSTYCNAEKFSKKDFYK